jgi:hypothetical protein
MVYKQLALESERGVYSTLRAIEVRQSMPLLYEEAKQLLRVA